MHSMKNIRGVLEKSRKVFRPQFFCTFSEEKMLNDKAKLHAMIDRLEVGLINHADIVNLRGLVERLDEMEDLVDVVCSCRTQEIPMIRMGSKQASPSPASTPQWPGQWDDNAPGRP